AAAGGNPAADAGLGGDGEFEGQVRALEAWLAAHPGRFPRDCGRSGPGEAQLSAFLRARLHEWASGRLPEARRARLAAVPGVEDRFKQVTRPRSFESLVGELAAWAERHAGRLPLAGALGAEERRLSKFLNNHRPRAPAGGPGAGRPAEGAPGAAADGARRGTPRDAVGDPAGRAAAARAARRLLRAAPGDCAPGSRRTAARTPGGAASGTSASCTRS
ncbi:unnamed protein product, partial [Prorocentrum cordatum]